MTQNDINLSNDMNKDNNLDDTSSIKKFNDEVILKKENSKDNK